jgi:peptidoglycan/LPS O-acetylase OafA/YrhL
MAQDRPADGARTTGRSGGRDTGSRDAGARDTGARGTTSGDSRSADRHAKGGSRVPWVALGVAAVLTLWQVIYSLTLHTMDAESQDVYTAVALFISLILGVAAIVLGAVALSQGHRPRWPATAALAIGVYVFVVTVASWVGGLMAPPA